MAGVRGNQAWWLIGTQSAKGTPAELKKYEGTGTEAGKYGTPRLPFSGGDLSVNRVFGKLAETDGSRNQGVSYAKVGGLQGSPETYVRGGPFALLAKCALGESADGGVLGEYTHTATAKSASPPYVTVWKAMTGVESEEQKLFERYENCFVNSLQVKSTAGEPLVASLNVLGTKTTRLTGKLAKETEETTIPALENGYVFNMNDLFNGKAKLGSSTPHTLSSFDFTLTNGVTVQQTDGFAPYDVVAGIRTVDLSFDLLFENIETYNEFQYGSAEGTLESNKLFKQKVELEFKHEYETGKFEKILIEVKELAYESYPIVPNVSGAPVIVQVKGVAQRPLLSTESICTITTTNQLKTVQ